MFVWFLREKLEHTSKMNTNILFRKIITITINNIFPMRCKFINAASLKLVLFRSEKIVQLRFQCLLVSKFSVARISRDRKR
jgi:hypothetical protein